MATLTKKKKSFVQVAQNSGFISFKKHPVEPNGNKGLDQSDFLTGDPLALPICQSCIEGNCDGDKVAGLPWLQLPRCPRGQQ